MDKRGAAALSFALLPISWLYGMGVNLRNTLYVWGFFRQNRLSIPVVSVGNVEVGGTGKTPLVIFLAEALSQSFRVGIVLRGYRGAYEHSKEGALIVARGEGMAASFGDEAALLAERLQEAIVVISKDRMKGAQLAIEKGANLIILDDGMQHRRLYRDFEIVAITPAFWKKTPQFLPAGVLRDNKKEVKRADAIVSFTPFGEMKPFSAPQIEMESSLKEVVSIESGEKVDIFGKKVAIFCGIAHPGRFEKSVKELGAEVLLTLFLADHETPSPCMLSHFIQKAKEKGAQLLLCTEKDRVKLTPSKYPLPIASVKMETRIKTNTSAWNELIKKIKARGCR